MVVPLPDAFSPLGLIQSTPAVNVTSYLYDPKYIIAGVVYAHLTETLSEPSVNP